MGAVGSVGPAGVTLQFAIARRGHGSCSTVRELNLAHRRRRAPWLLGAASEIRLPTGRLDCGDHHRQVTSDELRADAKGAVARACKLAVATLVRAHAARVIAAIDLYDQATTRRIEVSDEPEQRHLAPKRDPELARAQRAPQASLRVRGRLPHCVSVGAAPPLCVVVRPACSLRCARRGPPGAGFAGRGGPTAVSSTSGAPRVRGIDVRTPRLVLAARARLAQSGRQPEKGASANPSHPRRNAHHAKRSPNRPARRKPSGPPRPAQPASGGPPARGRKGARRAVLCRVPAGQPKPHGCRGERGACRRHLAVRDRAKGARLVRDGAGAQPRPPPKASSVAPLLRLQIYRGVVPAGRRRFAFISRRAAGMFTRLQWNRWIATLSKGSNRSFAERLGCSERSTLFARCGCLTGIWPRARS